MNDTSIEVFADENLMTEIKEVAYRDKFRKFISIEDVDIFIEVISLRLTIIKSTSIFFDSPDPDDNYLLALAIDAKADYLIMGDKKGIISLSPFQGISIIRLHELIDILYKS